MQGAIQHLFRSYVFVNSKTYPENGGTFVARARHVLSAGAKNQSPSTDGRLFGDFINFFLLCIWISFYVGDVLLKMVNLSLL